jgi:amino acid transporter
MEGFFASVCAFSFAKMSRYHDASHNGAAYVYTRSTFGKLTGLFVGFLQSCIYSIFFVISDYECDARVVYCSIH